MPHATYLYVLGDGGAVGTMGSLHSDQQLLVGRKKKVQWMLDHPNRARTIAHAGKLWISDLVYHLDADDDDNTIMRREMLIRYKQHFVHEPDLAFLENLAYHQP